MKLTHFLAAATLALAVSAPALAVSDKDADTFLLTPALFEKMKKAEPELKALNIKDDSESEEESTVDDIIKSIERHPKAKAVLAKHGLTSKEVALASVAMIHAGMYVALESQMDKKGAANLMAGYTREQRANIALMRTMAKSR
jgi:glutamine synthetase adenylyltransferase